MSDTPAVDTRRPSLTRALLWVVIAALIGSALISVFWVLVGDQSGLVGRAFLTVLALTIFAMVALAESRATRRPQWVTVMRIGGLVVTLAYALWRTWSYQAIDYPSPYLPHGVVSGFELMSNVWVVVVVAAIVQLALLHISLILRTYAADASVFIRATAFSAAGLVGLLAVLLLLPYTLYTATFPDLFWRIVVAVTILGAVATALAPLTAALTRPKVPRPVASTGQPQQPWPTYHGTAVPLPVMPDGQPDWGAYHSGTPSPNSRPAL